MVRKTHKGKFRPRNPGKYLGDVSNIVFRSGWELRTFKYLDENSNVQAWNSEEIVVAYISPMDGKPHRYFPDVYAEIRDKSGSIKKYLLEIKPEAETRPPEPPRRITEAYISKVGTFGVNIAKWEAARKYCQEKGWIFKLITEKDLGLRSK